MTSLERCADALLQQKALQNTNYEHLEHRINGLERNKRAVCMDLTLSLSDVERKRKDLAELRRGTERLDGELEQSKLKLSALSLLVTDDQKCQQVVEQRLTDLADTWVGLPQRITQLVRALQERKVLVADAQRMTASLSSVKDVVDCIRGVEQLQALAKDRCHMQETHAIACFGVLERQLNTLHGKQEEAVAIQIALRVECKNQQTKAEEIQRLVAYGQAETIALQAHQEALQELAHTARNATLLITDHCDAQCTVLEQKQAEQEALLASLQSTEARCEAVALQLTAESTSHKEKMAECHTATEEANTKRVALEESLASLHVRRSESMAALSTSQGKHRAVLVLLHVWHRVAADHEQCVAGRRAEKERLQTHLTQLRARHEAHLRTQREVRAQRRCQEALASLGSEESLTRKKMHADAEAAWQTLLQDEQQQRSDAATRQQQQQLVQTRKNAAKGQKRARPSKQVDSTVGDELGILPRKTYPFMGPLKHNTNNKAQPVAPRTRARRHGSSPSFYSLHSEPTSTAHNAHKNETCDGSSPPPRRPQTHQQHYPQHVAETQGSATALTRALDAALKTRLPHTAAPLPGGPCLKSVQCAVLKPSRADAAARGLRPNKRALIGVFADGDDIFADDFL